MPEAIRANLPFLLHGLATSLQIAAMVAVGGTLLGLAVALVLHGRVPGAALLCRGYVGFIRGTPLLVVLFITFFGLPALFRYRTTAFSASVVAFILFIGAYIAEDIRSGLRTVRPALVQAALASGLTRAQAVRFVVLPIALRRTLPMMFNQYVRLVKFTSVASVVGVSEFTGDAMLVSARVFQPVVLLAFVALTYLVLCLAISATGRWLYRKLEVA